MRLLDGTSSNSLWLDTIGDQAFPVAIVRTRNSMPSDVTSKNVIRVSPVIQNLSVFHFFPVKVRPSVK